MNTYCDEKTGQLMFVPPLPPQECDKETRLWRNFLEYHKKNPHIYAQYKSDILDLIKAGRDAFSICLLTENQRWYQRYKINNTHKTYYARIFVEEYPQYNTFFKFRAVKTA